MKTKMIIDTKIIIIIINKNNNSTSLKAWSYGICITLDGVIW